MEYDGSTGCAKVVDSDGSEMPSIETQSIETMCSWFINESTPEQLLNLPDEVSQQLLYSQQSNQTIKLDRDNHTWGTNTNFEPFQFYQLISPPNSTEAVGIDGFGELPVVQVSAPPTLPVPERMPISVEGQSLHVSAPSTPVLTGSKGPKKRKQIQLVPKDKKDSAYRQHRLKNNASVKKCREKAKQKSKKDSEGCININRAIRLINQILSCTTMLEGVRKNLEGMIEKGDGFQVSQNDSVIEAETDANSHE